jgi:peptidylprolyl isomerase
MAGNNTTAISQTDQEAFIRLSISVFETKSYIVNGPRKLVQDGLMILFKQDQLSLKTVHSFELGAYTITFPSFKKPQFFQVMINDYLDEEDKLKNEDRFIKKLKGRIDSLDFNDMRKPNVYFDVAVDNQPIGRIEFKLYDDDVPLTSANFRELCIGEKGFGYVRSTFHRIVPGFLVQGGMITNDSATGDKSIYGEYFDDENFTHQHSKPGILSMANVKKPNTNGSQFFITTAPAPNLNGYYVAFGEVVDGLDVVKIIERYGSSSYSPTAKIVITECGLLE